MYLLKDCKCCCWFYCIFRLCYSDSCFLFWRQVKFHKRVCWMLYFFSLWMYPFPWNIQAFMKPLQPIWSRWVLRTTVFIKKPQKLLIPLNALVALWLKFIRRCGISLYKAFSVGKLISYACFFPPCKNCNLALWKKTNRCEYFILMRGKNKEKSQIVSGFII